jgi:hypothetical protein
MELMLDAGCWMCGCGNKTNWCVFLIMNYEFCSAEIYDLICLISEKQLYKYLFNRKGRRVSCKARKENRTS